MSEEVQPNIHDRWLHKNNNAEICVKCGDTQSIDARYRDHHAGVPDSVCSSDIIWSYAYEKNQEYRKTPFWQDTRIATQESER